MNLKIICQYGARKNNKWKFNPMTCNQSFWIENCHLSQQWTVKTHTTCSHTDTKTHFTVIMLDFVLSLTLFGGGHFKRS